MIEIGRNLNIPIRRGAVVMGSELARLKSLPLPTFVFPSGEESKSFRTLESILNFLAENELGREDWLYALGGGVTGDLGGLAAALYCRGMKLAQVPTTLLAMVDSSVGGKTAVNLERGKNLAGVFKEADEIYIDLEFLKTLPKRIYNEGMAEVIKYSFICGEDLTLLPEEEMVRRCIEIKQEIVASDPYDRGARHVLNFGHTIGHGVEKSSGYSLLHGEAVAVGMVYITEIFNPELLPRLRSMLERFELPCSFEGEIDISSDKKREGGEISVVVPRSFGDCRIERMDFEEFRRLCKLT